MWWGCHELYGQFELYENGDPLVAFAPSRTGWQRSSKGPPGSKFVVKLTWRGILTRFRLRNSAVLKDLVARYETCISTADDIARIRNKGENLDRQFFGNGSPSHPEGKASNFQTEFRGKKLPNTSARRRREGSPRLLYIGTSSESQQVEEILHERKIDFIRFKVKDRTEDSRDEPKPPCLIAQEGRFSGLESIRKYVEALSALA